MYQVLSAVPEAQGQTKYNVAMKIASILFRLALQSSSPMYPTAHPTSPLAPGENHYYLELIKPQEQILDGPGNFN